MSSKAQNSPNVLHPKGVPALKFSCPEVSRPWSPPPESSRDEDAFSDDPEGPGVRREAGNNKGQQGGCSRSQPRTESSSSAALSVDSSSEESAVGVFVPPDGGWGWVVVFAAFLVNMIADGVTFSFGVLYVDFLQYFGQSKSKTAWIGSLFMGVPLLSGPIASSLTDRYGCRRVTICGALLAALGFVLSSVSNSVEALFLTFGIMSGFGLALCYVAAIVIVAYYFEKRRAFATGLSVCGSGLGTCFFAPFTQYLVDQYTWRGAVLILAGLFLNIVVCGALMRDLEWSPNRRFKGDKSVRTSAESISQKSQATPDEARKMLNNGNCAVYHNYYCYVNGVGTASTIPDDPKDCDRLCNSLVDLPTFVKRGESLPRELLERLGRHGVNYEYFLKHYPHLVNQTTGDQMTVANNNTVPGGHSPGMSFESPCGQEIEAASRPTKSPSQQRHHHQHRVPQQLTPQTASRRLSAAYFQNLRLHRRSMTYRNAMLNTHRYHIRASSCPDIYRNSMITIAQEEESEVCSCMDDVKEVFKDMLDFSYFKNVKFLIFCISNLLLYIWYDVPYVYIPDNARHLGIDEDRASYLVSVTGVLNTVGEVIFGYIGDKPWASSLLVYSGSTALCGAVLALVPLLGTFNGLAFCSGVFGLTISANYALTSIIVVDLITLENFTNAYGLLLLVQGIANLVGPPLAGYLYDVTGSYDWSFYMAGFWIFISGAVIAILPLWRRLRRSKWFCGTKTDHDLCDDVGTDPATSSVIIVTTPAVAEGNTTGNVNGNGNLKQLHQRSYNNLRVRIASEGAEPGPARFPPLLQSLDVKTVQVLKDTNGQSDGQETHV